MLGDIALIGRYDRTVRNDVDQRVRAVKEIIGDCDYVIANLESSLTSISRTTACKGVYLRSDPVNVQTLKEIGVTHVTLANNHTFDYGRRAVQETINTLSIAGIKYVGLNNPCERLVKEDSTILLDGFCCLSANGLNYGDKLGQIQMLSPETIERFLNAATEERSLPIASVHFGVEGVHYPSQEHMRFFRKFAKKYTYILHGNHPHALQGYEEYGSSLLIYAQGNLCFDVTPDTSIHEVPEETIEERKCYISKLLIEHNRVLSHEVIPVTDLGTNILHEDLAIRDVLSTYTNALTRSYKEIDQLRSEELKMQRTATRKRDLRFYMNRMNYKYVGAYLNGRKHAKAYGELFKQFMNGDISV